jgi:putative peptidoglycan lipid II flippase
MSDGSFHRHARTVSLLTIVSRFGGLARDAAMSRVFGVSPLMDAFALGFLVPNLFRRLFGEGALSAALLPVYAREVEESVATARAMARLVIARAMVTLAVIVILIEALLAVGVFSGEMDSSGVRLLAIMLPYAPMVCFVALIGAMLQAHGRFGPTAAAPLLLNGLLVASTLGLLPLVDAGTITRNEQVMLVAVSVLLAGVLQVIWSVVALRRVRIERDVSDRSSARALARKVGVQAIPMIIGLGVLQMNTLLDGLIASWPTVIGPTIPFLDVAYPLKEGSMATLSWAARLYEFPLGVFGIAIATAIFPQLSREHSDVHAFAATLRQGVRLALFVGLPASIGLVIVREPLAAVVLQGKAFTVADTEWTAFILLGYAWAIWAYCLNQLLVRAFYARGEAMTPVRVAIGMVGLNLALNLILIWTPLRVAGLSWSTGICAVLQVIVLAVLLSKRLAASGGGAQRSS